MPIPRASLEGQQFGLLTVLSFAGNNRHSQSTWLCSCTCGGQKTVSINALRNGMTRSCGCLRGQKTASRARIPGQFTCTKCRQKKPLEELLSSSNYRCQGCGPSKKGFDLARQLWLRARRRTESSGVEFSLPLCEVVIPRNCPVLGIPLERGRRGLIDSSPTLDRIDPRRGYVSGNVCVISWRANSLKKDASLEELRRLVRYVEERL